jgi:iron(III) transport system substrate-binding protein
MRPIVLGAVAVTLVASAVALVWRPSVAGEEVNLYSYRQPFLLQPITDAFTAETGIKVNVVFAKKGMLQRIRAAGRNNPADAVLTTDISRLIELKDAGVLDAVASDVLGDDVPAHLRDPQNQWFALTTRARLAVVSAERVKVGELASYEDLADPKFKGRICVRSGKHPYNIALIAGMIHHHGLDKARIWLRGVKANLARKPQGNDRAQAKAIYQGQCDVALMNNYYMGKMVTNEKKPEQKKWAAALRVIYLNQDGRGNHMNVSGAGVLMDAPNKGGAIKLIEFLVGDAAQKIYAEANHEYPVKPGVARSDLVRSWGDFKADNANMADIAKLRPTASKLVDEVRFDDGPGS